MGDTGRWVEVAPPGATTRLSLEQARAERPAGGFTGYVLAPDDIETTYRELSARGVDFTEPPTPQPWGRQAQFVDQDGNGFVLVQEEQVKRRSAARSLPAAPLSGASARFEFGATVVAGSHVPRMGTPTSMAELLADTDERWTRHAWDQARSLVRPDLGSMGHSGEAYDYGIRAAAHAR